ncbi:MAG: response regulator [Alphaproteobacteria bacterium]|nr:response regulator [Alphaproteobacteria bacterium]
MAEAARTVLIVDDEPLVLQATADLLADDGCAVLLAGSFAEAIERLEAAPAPDVLVTDIRFSGGPDGIALARTVAERWPQVRIVIVSGEVRPAGSDYPENALFFTKPYAPGALVTMVREGAEWARG